VGSKMSDERRIKVGKISTQKDKGGKGEGMGEKNGSGLEEV